MPPKSLPPGVATALAAIRTASASPPLSTSSPPQLERPAKRGASTSARKLMRETSLSSDEELVGGSRMIPSKRGRSLSPGFEPPADEQLGGGAVSAGEQGEEKPVKKKRAPRKLKPKEPVVYVIPDVEKRETTYK